MVRRVLHYVGKMDFGGMEAMIMNLYRNIDRSKWQFDFAVHSDKRGCYEDEIEAMGGIIYRFPMMRSNPYKYKRMWNDFWLRHKGEYEVFQFHTNSLANIIALQAAARVGVPKRIVHAHSAYANKGRLQFLNDVLHKFHRNQINKYANMCFACSELAANWMFGKDCLQKGKAILLNNGVDYCRFAFNLNKRNKLREELGIQDKLTLVQIGSFLPVKNHKFTIHLIKQLVELGHKNFICLFLGQGKIRKDIEDLVHKENIEKYTLFLGARSNVEDYLSASDVFIMPSLYEGMPLSVVEAQASGVMCLVSDNITSMAKVSDNIEYLSIDDVKDWVKHIKNVGLNDSRSSTILDNRLNIQNTVQIYTDYISR